MELVRLQMGCHRELICFVVASKMIEVIILGLAWLDKWDPTIMWEDAYRKLRIGIGPLPPILRDKCQHALNPGSPSRLENTAATTDGLPGCPQVPKEYWDMMATFSEQDCNFLPSHLSTDCN